MSDFVFDGVMNPWDMALSKLSAGDTMSVGRFFALLEQSDMEAELAALELEEQGVMLDISDLPRLIGGSRTEERVEREARLYRQGCLLENLEDRDPLKACLKELQSISPVEDELELTAQAAQGSQEAMEELTQSYLPLVYELAGEFLQRGVMLMDLMQEGNFGLWRGVMRYQGGNFGEQAHWWIRQAMARAVTLQAYANGVGSHMAQAMERYRRADRALLTRLGRNPLDEEIALEMGVTADEAVAVGKMLREVEKMERVRKASEPKEPDPEEDQAVEDTAYFQSRQRIDEMLSGLSDVDGKILALRFGLNGKAPQSVQQTAQTLGLTVEEVTRRESEALIQLRGNHAGQT